MTDRAPVTGGDAIRFARNDWRAAAAFERFTCNTDGSLICGTMSNLFPVEDMALVTLPVRELAGHPRSIGRTTRKRMRHVHDAGVAEITC